jgi:hypothetical protein
MKRLEAVRKHILLSDTENNITVMCNKVKTELHRLRAQEEKKQKTDWLKI